MGCDGVACRSNRWENGKSMRAREGMFYVSKFPAMAHIPTFHLVYDANKKYIHMLAQPLTLHTPYKEMALYHRQIV